MKVRALSPNLLNFSSKSRWYDNPILGFVYFRWKSFKTWVLNIFRRRKNIVRMRALKRSAWYDCDTRIFEANFQILVDYVEGELAWMQLITEGKTHWYHRWFPIKDARELALRYLEWETQLGNDSPDQAEQAAKVRDLYLWYKDVRPNRPEPYDEIPHRPFEFEDDEENGYLVLKSLHDDDEYVTAVKKAQEQEEAYEEEDTSRLVQLVQLRRMMWT
jgi:hypothetical protein